MSTISAVVFTYDCQDETSDIFGVHSSVPGMIAYESNPVSNEWRVQFPAGTFTANAPVAIRALHTYYVGVETVLNVVVNEFPADSGGGLQIEVRVERGAFFYMLWELTPIAT